MLSPVLSAACYFDPVVSVCSTCVANLIKMFSHNLLLFFWFACVPLSCSLLSFVGQCPTWIIYISNAINPDRKLHDFSPFKYPSVYSGLSNSFFFLLRSSNENCSRKGSYQVCRWCRVTAIIVKSHFFSHFSCYL